MCILKIPGTTKDKKANLILKKEKWDIFSVGKGTEEKKQRMVWYRINMGQIQLKMLLGCLWKIKDSAEKGMNMWDLYNCFHFISYLK